MNIHETWAKIKYRQGPLMRDAAMPLLVVLVGLGSFGLGRMSTQGGIKAPITVTNRAVLAAAAGATLEVEGSPGEGKVVASKTGSKYHFPWCGSASKISENNKVWFDSEEAARKAGYTPAGNCKGLK